MRTLKHYGFLFICLIISFNAFSQTRELDSLRNLIRASKPDSARANLLIQLAWDISFTDSDSAIFYGKKALEFSKSINYSNGIANVTYKIGTFYHDKGEVEKALDYYIKSLKIYNKNKDMRGAAISLAGIGNAHHDLGNYPLAIEYLLKAKSIDETLHKKGFYNKKEKLQNDADLASDYGNLGNVYISQHDFKMAFRYYEKAHAFYTRSGNRRRIAYSLVNLGVACQEMKDYKRALDYYRQAYIISAEFSDDYLRSVSIGNLGNAYALLKQNDTALKYIFMAKSINEATGNKHGMAVQYGNIGELYIPAKRFKESREYLEKSLTLSFEIGHMETIVSDYLRLSLLDSATGNYKQAFENYKLYIIYKDSIYNEENTRKQTQVELQDKFERKKEADKAKREKDKALANAAKRRQQIVLALVSGVLLLAMIFSIVIFRNLRFVRKQKTIIEKQKSLVDEQKSLADEKQKELFDSIYYARRIQRALLPNEKYIMRFLRRRGES